MLRRALLVLASVSLGCCALADPGAPYFSVGATLTGDGRVQLRIASCLAGTLEEVSVRIDSEASGVEPALWRVTAEADAGPAVAEGDAVDVVIGETRDGLVESMPLEHVLPEDQTIQAEIRLSSQSFGYAFRPRELEPDTFLVEGGGRLGLEEFDDHTDALCS